MRAGALSILAYANLFVQLTVSTSSDIFHTSKMIGGETEKIGINRVFPLGKSNFFRD